ncbi:hypothetical protein MIND_00359500 [Mycena indigotica]|uniref:Ion channel n=1 Tax=Mycena indigotica TaxID=2126181 RepID=A0A8H6WCL7_9AGAR|nr:uncharacterized protein MIND_00359500 [Mycena indigotica]KAF7309873.1 hypothetical protein MIND_00359500 [Mycena indigotica]
MTQAVDNWAIDIETNVVRRVQGVWAGFKGMFCLNISLVTLKQSTRLFGSRQCARGGRRSNHGDAGGFSNLVNSLVTDVLLPPISLLPFLGRNLPAKFSVLRAGRTPHAIYNTLEQAAADGAVTLAWGAFVNNVVTFLALGIVLYGIAEVYSLLTKESIIRHIVKCKYCRKDISQTAQRCAFCTSWLDGREEKSHLSATNNTLI